MIKASLWLIYIIVYTLLFVIIRDGFPCLSDSGLSWKLNWTFILSCMQQWNIYITKKIINPTVCDETQKPDHFLHSYHAVEKFGGSLTGATLVHAGIVYRNLWFSYIYCARSMSDCLSRYFYTNILSNSKHWYPDMQYSYYSRSVHLHIELYSYF